MKATVLAAAGAALLLTGCDGLKQAMTAHVNVAATAGSQELSATRLANMLAKSKIPLSRDAAKAVADTWVDYQLLAQSLAKGDTVLSGKALDSAMWSAIANVKAKKFYDIISKSWTSTDTAAAATRYNNGDILAASHILILTQNLPDSLKAQARKKADALRAQVTAANFAELARKNSQDRQSAVRGGDLGIIPKGATVPQFEKALAALRPGEISPVVESQFGYHIIRRPTYSEVKAQVIQAASQGSMQTAESTYLARLESNAKLEVKSDAAANVRSMLKDLNGSRDSKTVLATTKDGPFTVGRLSQWLESFPPQAQVVQRLQSAPDSVIPNFVRNFVRNDLVLKQADSAGIGPTAAELAQLRQSFVQGRAAAWSQLGIDPLTMADSAKSASERERFATARVDGYMSRLLAGQAQFVEIPPALSRMLRDRFKNSVNDAGLDRALQEAGKVRNAGDSVRKAPAPPSVVPIPPAPAGQQPRP